MACVSTYLGQLLTRPQVYGLAVAAGFHDLGAVYATAVAEAESSRWTDARNDCDPSARFPNGTHARGLMQILLEAHGQAVYDQAGDPLFAMRYSYTLSSGGVDFRPWEAWLVGTAQNLVESVELELGLPLTAPPGPGAYPVSTGPPQAPPGVYRGVFVVPAWAKPIEQQLQRLSDDVYALSLTLGFPQPTPVVIDPELVHYVVVAGDTLFTIASAQLGSGERWREIYALNWGIIGDDPNVITVGDILLIPNY